MTPQPQSEHPHDPSGAASLSDSPSDLVTPAPPLSGTADESAPPPVTPTPTSSLEHVTHGETNNPASSAQLLALATTAQGPDSPSMATAPMPIYGVAPVLAASEPATAPEEEGTRPKTIKIPLETIRQIERRIQGTENSFHGFCLDLIVRHATLLDAEANANALQAKLDQAYRDLADSQGQLGDVRVQLSASEALVNVLESQVTGLESQLDSLAALGDQVTSADQRANEAYRLLTDTQANLTDLRTEHEQLSLAKANQLEGQRLDFKAELKAAVLKTKVDRDALYLPLFDELCQFAADHSNGVVPYTKQYFLNYLGTLLLPLIDTDGQ